MITLEIKKFRVKYNGEYYGPDMPNGPIIPEVDEKTAKELVERSGGTIVEQPKARVVGVGKKISTEVMKAFSEMTLEELNLEVSKVTTKDSIVALAEKIESELGIEIDTESASNNDKRKEAIKEALEAHFTAEGEEWENSELPPVS